MLNNFILHIFLMYLFVGMGYVAGVVLMYHKDEEVPSPLVS